jgi:hypothetical protein
MPGIRVPSRLLLHSHLGLSAQLVNSNSRPIILATQRLTTLSRQFSSTAQNMAPLPNEVDILVVGGGSAGVPAARRAGALYGKTSLIIEGNRWGGTCVNVGYDEDAIATKLT